MRVKQKTVYDAVLLDDKTDRQLLNVPEVIPNGTVVVFGDYNMIVEAIPQKDFESRYEIIPE